jgi:hypothetical protein
VPELPPVGVVERLRVDEARRFELVCQTIDHAVSAAQVSPLEGAAFRGLLADMPVTLRFTTDGLRASFPKGAPAKKSCAKLLDGFDLYVKLVGHQRATDELRTRLEAFLEPRGYAIADFGLQTTADGGYALYIHRVKAGRPSPMLGAAKLHAEDVLADNPTPPTGMLTRTELFATFGEHDQKLLHAAVTAITTLGIEDHPALIAAVPLDNLKSFLHGASVPTDLSPRDLARCFLRFILATDIKKLPGYDKAIAFAIADIEKLYDTLAQHPRPWPDITPQIPPIFARALAPVSREDAVKIMSLLRARTYSTQTPDDYRFSVDAKVTRDEMKRLLETDAVSSARPPRSIIAGLLRISDPPNWTALDWTPVRPTWRYDMMGMPLEFEPVDPSEVPWSVPSAARYPALDLPSDWWAWTELDRNAWHALYKRFCDTFATPKVQAAEPTKYDITVEAVLATVPSADVALVTEALAALREPAYKLSDDRTLQSFIPMTYDELESLLSGKVTKTAVTAEDLVQFALNFVGTRKPPADFWNETMTFTQDEVRAAAARYRGRNSSSQT